MNKDRVTRADVVDAVNRLIVRNNRLRRGPILVPLLRYRAWQQAVFTARQRRLFPADVLTAVAKHGVYDPEAEQMAKAA